MEDRTAFGTWVFITSEWLFFGALLLAYGQARWAAPDGFSEAARHTHVVLGTCNTAVLLTSSAIAAAAQAWLERGERRQAAAACLATALLGVAFLAIKAFEYRQEWQEALVPSASFALATVPGARTFFGLYWLMTAVHAVHLLAGIALMATLAYQVHRPGRTHVQAADTPRLHRRMAATTLYWHFVDIVWIVLYPLLYLAGRSP